MDLIKIDVKNFEKEVFDGGENFIAKNKPIIIFEYSRANKQQLLARL